jgi:hypothetical protein
MLKNELSEYKQELAERICTIIATHTDSFDDLIEKFDLPPKSTIYEWLWKNDAFSEMYKKAKMRQAELMAEELEAVANKKAYYVDADGNQRIDPGFTQSQRLIADTRKWIATKLAPRIYGDKQTIEQTVTVKHEDALKELE